MTYSPCDISEATAHGAQAALEIEADI